MTHASTTKITAVLLAGMLAIPALAQRKVAVIVDTSSSMRQNDRPRYSAQVAKILSDLMGDQDHYAVLRMPSYARRVAGIPLLGTEDCQALADPTLMHEWNAAGRLSYKDGLDNLVQFNAAGTYFSADVHTALPFLGTSGQRLLLIVTDAEVSDVGCTDQAQEEIARFRASGATTALINVGQGAGFQNSNAFTFQRAAPDSRNLIAAVAEIYQRFLGSQKLVQGNWQGSATLPVDPHVKAAYFIAAADGSVGALRGAPNNPSAQIDYNYRGGGETTGVDGRQRGYRIAHLVNPSAGTYTFQATSGNDPGGWILIQEYAIGLRSATEGPVAPGTPSKVRFELFDERNGRPITDTSSQPDLRVTVTLDGKTETLTNPVNGVFTTERTFSSVGFKPYTARLEGRFIDRRSSGQAEVINGGWRLSNLSPSEARLNDTVVLKVKADSFGGRAARPGRILGIMPGGLTMVLNDSGKDGDEKAGDGIYSVRWVTGREGRVQLEFRGETPNVETMPAEITVKAPSAAVQPAPPSQQQDQPVPVPPGTTPPQAAQRPSSQSTSPPPPPPLPPLVPAPPDFEWGSGRSVVFGKIKGSQTGSGLLDLNGAKVSAPTEVEVSTDFKKKKATLEINTGRGWKPISDLPERLTLEPGQSHQFAMRLKVEECPEACGPGERHGIKLTARKPGGGDAPLSVPVEVEVVPEPWWWCWRRELIGALIGLVSGVILYGFIVPLRFKRRLGVQLATDENISEGRFYELRSRRGSRIGWYRDSRVYLSDGFVISGKKRGALVSFIASRNGLVVRPVGGRTMMRQRIDGEWETVTGDQPGRVGSLYRNEGGSLYFEIRNK